MFDTHAHLNFSVFKDDYKEIIKQCLDRNIRIINIGSQYDTSKRAAEIAGEYDNGIYAAIGIHPIHLSHTEVDEEEINFRSREEKDRPGYWGKTPRTEIWHECHTKLRIIKSLA